MMGEHRIPLMDGGAVKAIRDGGIRVIDGNMRAIEELTAEGVRFSDGEERLDKVPCVPATLAVATWVDGRAGRAPVRGSHCS